MAQFDGIKTNFAAGEISPKLWGRTDMALFHNGTSVARNCFANYQGGYASRAGLKLVVPCRQSADALPPRIITFAFSTTQNYVLEFGEAYMRVMFNGAPVSDVDYFITNVTRGTVTLLTCPGNTFNAGDMLLLLDIVGATELNERYVIWQGGGAATAVIKDIFGNDIDSTNFGAYNSGGVADRIFVTASPYATVDLPFLKFAQSADVMTLCCVNHTTGTEYAPVDLKRLAATNWQFVTSVFVSTINPPGIVTAFAAVASPAPLTQFAYVVTSISNATGEESIASQPAYCTGVDIGSTAGSNTITWTAVPGAAYYLIYKAPPAYDATVPVGTVFGYMATAFGVQFVDSNITADFARTPPLHANPFARGRIIGANVTAPGTGYVQATTSVSVTTGTGSGAVIVPVVNTGAVSAFIVNNEGQGYLPTDTLVVAGAGTGATGTLVVGKQTGTYPGEVAYFQQRRAFGGPLNNPDTVFMSQTGAFNNFDASVPPIDSDAIITSPWAQQVNGIQWMIPMPGGLIVATGLDAWQLQGTGGPYSAFTPSSQSAQPQETNGFADNIQPIKNNYELMYVQSLGTVVRVLQYNYFINIYAGTDISFQSNHLFKNFQIVQWALAREPFKVIWTVRNDGKFLSLTYLKEQQVQGWCRHDTNGEVVGITVAEEPPVNAPYFVVKRFIAGPQKFAYFIERMDDREWITSEDVFAVDCGISNTQGTPAATLVASAATGNGVITGAYVTDGGGNYTNPIATIITPQGQTGSGGTLILSWSLGGPISGVTLLTPGSLYRAPVVSITDSTGSGAKIALTITQDVTFTASAAVFNSSMIGWVIRMGGGIATIDSYISATQVTASFVRTITDTYPDDPYITPIPAQSGEWTLTKPIQTLTNLDYLEGMTVTGLADGSVIPPTVVKDGIVVLPNAATDIKIGLPFISQIQSLHAEAQGAPTIQHKRKHISRVMVRVSLSRGVQVGANQPVASTFENQQEIPWTNMTELPNNTVDLNTGAPIPLVTGDFPVTPISDGWMFPNGAPSAGMIAAQQIYPLPMNVLAFVATYTVGDGP